MSKGGATRTLELVFPGLVGCHEAAVTREGVVPHVKEEMTRCDVAAAEEVRAVLLTALPLSSANLPHEQPSRQHRHLLDRAGLVDLCASVYRQRGRVFQDPVYRTRVWTEIYMDKPIVQPNGSTQHPSTFFEVAEWNPLDATHRLMLRNALVAHVQLSQLRDKVGHFWTHPIRNAFLLNQDGKSGLRAQRDGHVAQVSEQPWLTAIDND